MDQGRFEKATALQREGRIEDACREFHSMAAESNDPNERAALLINEVRCYADLGRVADAELILQQIRDLAPDDSEARFSVDFVEACVAAQGGKHEKAVLHFEATLKGYVDLLQTDEYRDLYEEIQQRKAFSLVHLQRYQEAIPVLRDASSFGTLGAETQQQVHLYLGICHAELHEPQLAKEQFLGVLDFGLKNATEADARYNLGVVCFLDGGFAQSKHQLETILQDYPETIPNVPRNYVYQQLSRACHYLGEKENAKRYAKLADDTSL